MRKGQEFDPLSLIINVAVGWSLYCARRYDEAIEHSGALSNRAQTTRLLLDSRPVAAKNGLLRTGHQRGREGRELVRPQPSDACSTGAHFRHGWSDQGSVSDARRYEKASDGKVCRELLPRGNHVGLGDYDRAIEYLEKSLEEDPTGLSIFISIRAWMSRGTIRVFKTSCGVSAFPQRRTCTNDRWKRLVHEYPTKQTSPCVVRAS